MSQNIKNAKKTLQIRVIIKIIIKINKFYREKKTRGNDENMSNDNEKNVGQVINY